MLSTNTTHTAYHAPVFEPTVDELAVLKSSNWEKGFRWRMLLMRMSPSACWSVAWWWSATAT
ncbi:hypothetical protein [Comamonas sp. B21-038]|uniref:hypothetical protein n=1 Tax=Comamonas sp. B21-038 TaxID=2918299 RepID=UPI001EFAF5D7|nr:hypothetical protein [Comamonas sp. B21-038]ULR90096.1 hypothetical protein MJ205_04250 [Comamonas sp. B21-038]